MRYDIRFEDGSYFLAPTAWLEVYQPRFAAMDPAKFEKRLRFIVSKYAAHRTIPTSFDGTGCEEIADAKYDNPSYYAEAWDNSFCRQRGDAPPSLAEIADGVLYQSMRCRAIPQELAGAIAGRRPNHLTRARRSSCIAS